PRRNCLSVSVANQRSTRLIHEAPVGLSRPVPLVKLADDLAGLDIERREERGRAERNRWYDARLAWAAAETATVCDRGLRSRLFRPRRGPRPCRVDRVEPNNVADFLDDQRVFGQLERLDPMRLQRSVCNLFHLLPTHDTSMM